MRVASLRTIAKTGVLAGPVFAVCAALFFEDWAARRFLALYVGPLCAALCAWVWLKLGEPKPTPRVLVLDIIVVAVAAARFLTGVIPVSGHMLFLVYTGLTQRSSWYRILALALVIETTVFKLWIWQDWSSWGLGAVAGLVATLLHYQMSRGIHRIGGEEK